MDRLDELMLQWEERRDRGERISAAMLSPHDQGIARKLEERIRLIQAFDDLTRDIPTNDCTPEAAPAALPAVHQVGKYEVRGELGIGGMGVVYLAWDPALRREIAVKMIRSTLFTNKARFDREGHALAQLKHPNIVGVYEAGTDLGRPYLAMEYVRGGSLKEHLERFTQAGPAAVARVMERVSRAVQFAHERGVLHRDLKPANILLGPGDEPLVADFGLAKFKDQRPPGQAAVRPAAPSAETVPDARELALTDTYQPGTPLYMAPEQFDPSLGPVGPATDIWALGVIMYEMAVGKRPFSGADYVTLSTQIHEPPDYSSFRAPAARRLAAVIARCLQVHPEKRFSSAAELADALRFPREIPRRTLLAGALLAGAAGLGTIAWRWWSPRDSELEGFTNPRGVREALERLSRGEEVALVRDGKPIGYRLPLGPGSGRVVASATQQMQVLPNGICVIELLPSLPPGEWIVEATLRHLAAFDGSAVGTIVCVQQVTGQSVQGVTGFVLVFSEANPSDKEGKSQSVANTRVVLVDNAPDKAVPEKRHLLQQSVPFLVQPGPNHGSPPRVLKVILQERGISADVEELKFPPCVMETFDAVREGLLNKAGYPEGGQVTTFRGGIGLYCSFGTAEVQSFTVRPHVRQIPLAPPEGPSKN